MFASIGYYICVPFAWLVRLFYNLADNYGLALILFTLVIKLIMLPFQIKSKKSMLRMNRMSGKMQEIQKKYANNQVKMQEEIQRLYVEEGVNPMSGCLWSFLPLPILMALYSIIRQPITHFMMLGGDVLTKLVNAVADAGLSLEKIVMFSKDGVMQMKDGIPVMQPYGQIELANTIATKLPEVGDSIDGWMNVNYSFLGLDLSRTPSSTFAEFAFTWAIIGLILIPIISGLSQLLMSKVAMSTAPGANGAAQSSTKMMMYMMPLFSVYIAFIMPAALGVYWIAQSVFSLIQELLMNKFFNKRLEEEENAKYEAKVADRQRRQEEARKLQEQRKNEVTKKLTLKEKQEAAQAAKAAKAAKRGSRTNEAGRVGERPYARGRAYQEDRYDREG